MRILPDMIPEMRGNRFLVEYKGGGYSGCFWEWNYFAFIDGQFHNIFSSGYKGIKDETQAIAFLEETAGRRSGMSVCDLTDEESMALFVSNGNASNMFGIAQYFQEHIPEIEIKGYCDNCGILLPVLDMAQDNWSGDGGIAYSAKDLICLDCECELFEEENDPWDE